MATHRLQQELPAAAEPAVWVTRRLREAGFRALLAGGCVRDLLLGQTPKDFDVATDARPEQVRELFRRTRAVGVHFGVVLVKRQGSWIEVATFRSDGPYLDGRRPAHVTYTDAEHDARRRDFTINGMFLDPLAGELLDYVGGREDLAAGVVRAIGEPTERIAEDYLRMLRAVRFAAGLGFSLDPATAEAVRENAAMLPQVAAERIHDELARMLAGKPAVDALRLLRRQGLLENLWEGAAWSEGHLDRAETLLGRIEEPSFVLAFAILVADREETAIQRICRRLAFSNERREAVLWLVARQGALDDPAGLSLADLKQLLASEHFGALRKLAASRHADYPDGAARTATMERRIAAIPLERIAPPPLITGADLHAAGLAPGPAYKRILNALYIAQLNEDIETRTEAKRKLEQLMQAEAGR